MCYTEFCISRREQGGDMEYRTFGRTGWNISAIGFGAWGIGGDWGPTDDKTSLAALHRALDLLQLDCPPSEVYDMPEVFGILDDLVQQGKIRSYGVSVERVDEALKAVSYPHVQSVQIIFNLFRLKPSEHFFSVAR